MISVNMAGVKIQGGNIGTNLKRVTGSTFGPDHRVHVWDPMTRRAKQTLNSFLTIYTLAFEQSSYLK